jgi:DnaK suppressor protein
MDIEKHKVKLLQEESRLELELTDTGVLNSVNPSDWTAVGEAVVETADLNVLADADEAQEINKAIVNQLEVRFKNVKDALVRIEGGTYGICEACNTIIEPARLDANPAAATCIECAS